jgi:hypothetical protein
MLTRLDIFRLVVKFVGLLILMQALVILLFVAQEFPTELRLRAEQGWLRDTETLIVLVTARFLDPVIYLLVGLAAIWWGNRAIRRVEPIGHLDSPAEATDLLKLEAVLYGLLGTYLVVDGVARLAGILSSSISNSLMNRSSISDGLMSNIDIGSIAKIAFGICLILRRDGMAALRILIARWTKAARRWPN